MEELVASLAPGLQYVFRTTRPVYISSSSATGLMEGAVRNGARRKVLSLVNGAFSERFHRIAVACGLEADVLEVPLGQGHSPDLLDHALGERTTTRSRSCIPQHPRCLESDRRARESGARERRRRTPRRQRQRPSAGRSRDRCLGADFVLTGSQKALALPPGLALGVAASIASRAGEDEEGSRHLLDFIEFERVFSKTRRRTRRRFRSSTRSPHSSTRSVAKRSRRAGSGTRPWRGARGVGGSDESARSRRPRART